MGHFKGSGDNVDDKERENLKNSMVAAGSGEDANNSGTVGLSHSSSSATSTSTTILKTFSKEGGPAEENNDGEVIFTSVYRNNRTEIGRGKRTKDNEKAKGRWIYTILTFVLSASFLIGSQLQILLTDELLFDSSYATEAYAWITVRLAGSVVIRGLDVLWSWRNASVDVPTWEQLDQLGSEEKIMKALRRRMRWIPILGQVWTLIKYIWTFYGIQAIIVRWDAAYNVERHTAVMEWSIVFWTFTALMMALYIVLLLFLFVVILITAFSTPAATDHEGLTEDEWELLCKNHEIDYKEFLKNQMENGPGPTQIGGTNDTLQRYQSGTTTPVILPKSDGGGVSDVGAMLVKALSGLGGVPPVLSRDITASQQHESHECPICMCDFDDDDDDDPIIQLPCHVLHLSHKSCLKPWVFSNGTCPTCRASISKLIKEEV